MFAKEKEINTKTRLSHNQKIEKEDINSVNSDEDSEGNQSRKEMKKKGKSIHFNQGKRRKAHETSSEEEGTSD